YLKVVANLSPSSLTPRLSLSLCPVCLLPKARALSLELVQEEEEEKKASTFSSFPSVLSAV
uniref:Uncharacterized protein n=1 Tax=Oryza brachyantha TaxID=4533 RepID=J3MDR6_ORYBR